MIQERATERGVKKVVTQRVLLRELAFRQVGRVEVAHDQTGIVTPGDKPIHFAVIDLRLLMPVAVDDVTSLVCRQESAVVENVVWEQSVEAGVKACIYRRRALVRINGLWWRRQQNGARY